MPAQIVRDHYSAHQLADLLGLERWQFRVGLEHGLLPEPDLVGDRWSAALAEQARPLGGEIIARFGDVPPVGSNRAAARLAVRMGLDVERRDIEVLVAQGDLNVISSFRGHPVYLLEELDALDPGKVRQVVSARKGPLTETADAGGAATILGWPRRTFDRIAAERKLIPDKLGRYRLSDVQALKADEALVNRVAAEEHRRELNRRRRTATRTEDAVRTWILRCSAYLDGDADHPPATAPLVRALRGLHAIRTEIAPRDPLA